MNVIPSLTDLRRLPVDDLERVARDLRAALIACVATTGGHFGSNLGVVELSVALHYVYETPADRLIWDVGHQSYPHKMLTGRLDRMHTLRQHGGLSGFTRRAESEFDPFGAAHSSTSVSAALGMAVARDLSGSSHHVVCVIGDGALSAGLAFEGLNNAGGQRSRMVIVLNDNDMSIAPPVGALSATLKARRMASPAAASPASYFAGLGLTYRGPIDGHDLAGLVAALQAARGETDGPVLLHVVTQKGRGYAPAERAADRGHSTNPFDPVTGASTGPRSTSATYTDVFADSLLREARNDDRIVAVTAAMPSGTGLDRFQAAFPTRCFDAGIAEQHAVTFAAGLATEGYKPFVAIYSTFLQRAYDQIVHDVAIQGLPVRFCLDRAGLVGQDGPTHAGAFDLAYLCCLPGMVVMAPSDGGELADMVATAANYDEGPIALRYPRGTADMAGEAGGHPLPIGKGRLLQQGTDIAIVSLGTRLAECVAAADLLRRDGLTVSVADARFAKPLDAALLLDLAASHAVLLTVEEGASGGFGAGVQRLVADHGSGAPVRSLCLPDRFLGHGKPEQLYKEAGLDRHGIAETARRAFLDSGRSERTAVLAAQ